MALNVLLVFFLNYNADQLRHLEKWYFLFSYGAPFITALGFILNDHLGTRRIFGPATVSLYKCHVRATLIPSDMVLDRTRTGMDENCVFLRARLVSCHLTVCQISC